MGAFGWQSFAEAETDTNGQYALRALKAQTYSIVAGTPRFKRSYETQSDGSVWSHGERWTGPDLCQEVAVSVADAKVSGNLQFKEQPAIRGRVEDSAGQRIAGARVSAESRGRCPMREAIAGDDGSFVIERPDAVVYRVWAAPPAEAKASKERPAIVEARPGDDRLVLVAPRD